MMSQKSEKDEARQILDDLIKESTENQQEIDQNSYQTLRLIQKKKKELKLSIANEIVDRLLSKSIDDSQKQILSNLSKNIYEGEDQLLKQQFNSLFTQQVENMIINSKKESQTVKDLLQIIQQQADRELYSFESDDSKLFTQIRERLQQKGISTGPQQAAATFQNSFPDLNKPFSFDDQQFDDIKIQGKEQNSPFDKHQVDQGKSDQNKNTNLLDFDGDNQFNQNNIQKDNNEQNFNWDQFQFGDINTFSNQEKQEENKQQQQFSAGFDMDWFKNNESVHSQISQKQSGKSNRQISNKQQEEKQEFNLSDFIQNSQASHSQSVSSNHKDFSLTDLGLQKRSQDLKDSGVKVQMDQNVLNFMPQINTQQIQETPKQSKQILNMEESSSNQKQSQESSSQLQNKFKDYNQNQKPDEIKINLIKSDNQLIVGSNNVEDNQSSSFGKGEFVLKFGMNESQLRKNVVQQNANIKDDEIDQNLLNPKNISDNYLLQGYKQAQFDMRLNNMLGSVQKCESENSRSGSHFQDSQAQQSLQNLEFFLKFDQNQSKNILSDEGLPNIGDKSQQLSSNRKDKDNQIQLKLNENKNMMQNNSNINEPNEAVQKKDNVDLTEKVNLDNMWDEMESYKSEVASKQSLEDSYIAQKVAAVQGRINTLNKSNLNLSQASIKSSVSKKSDQQKNSQIINKSQNLNQKTNELLQRSKKYQEYPLKENVQFTHSSQSLNQQNQINNDSKQNSANKQEQKVNLSQNVFFDQSSTSHNNYNFEDFGMNQSQMSETSSKSSVVMPRNEEENFQTNSQLNVKETNENFNQIKMQIDQQKSQLGKLSSISNKKHSDSLSQQNEQLSQKTQEIIERANNLKRSQNISNENINQNVKLHQSNSSQQKGLYKDEQSSKIKDLIERSQKSIQKTNENFMKYSVSSNAVSNKSKSQINQVKMTSSQQSQNQKEKSLNFEDFGNLNISQSQSQNDSQIISEYIKQQIQGCKDSDISNNKNNNFLDNNSTIKQKQVSSKIENSNNFDFDEFGSVHESESNQSKSSIINVIHANTIKNLQNKFSNAQKEMQAGDISKTISVGIQYSDDKKASGQFNFSDFQSVEQSAVSNITQFQEQQNKQQQSQINPNNNSSSSNSQIFPQTISQIFKQNDRITKSDINQQFNQFQNIEHSLSDNDKDVNYLSNLSQFTKNSDINEEICKNSERKELAELAQSVSSSRSKVQYVQHKIIEDYQNEDKSQLDTLQEQPLKEDNELSHQFYMSNQQKHNFQDFFGNQDENIDPDNQFIEEQKVINERLNTPKCALNKNDFINNQDFQQPQYQNQNQQIYIDQKSSSFQQFGQDFNSDNQTLNTHNYTNQAFQNIQEVSGQIKSENSSKKQIQPNIIQQNMIKTFDQNLSETQDFNNQFQINDQSDQKNQIENQMYNQFNENQNKEFQQLPSLPTVNFQSNSNFNVAAVDMQNDLERDLHHSQIRGRQEIDSQMNQNSKNQMQQFNQNLEYQQKSYQTEEKNDNNLNIDQSISFENEYNQRLNLQDHQQNFSMQNKSKSALNLENQEIAEKYSQLDQQQQSDQYGFYEQNVNKNNINQDNFGEQMQQQFLQQTQQQSNQNNSQNQIKNNDQQNENEANMGIQQQVQTNYTNVANNFEQEQGDYRAQEYKLMSSQLQNSNLCSEDSQDQFSSFQQANQTKYIKQKQNQQDDHQHHNEVSDEQKDSFIYEQDKQIILEYEDNNIKQNDQENQLNNYVQNEQIEEQYQEQQDNLTDKMVDQSNNLNTFFLNQKQQVLYTFDHSQYQQGVKGLDLYSKGEIMYFQDQQSQIESQTQNQQNQFTQDFEQLRKKKQVFDSYGSDSQYQDQDENIIGQQILFSDQIQPTVLETVKEQKQPEIDLFMGDNKDFSNQNLFNPKAKNVNQDDEASFGEEQDEEYEQKLKQQYQNQPVQREDQNVNQEQFQFDPQNQELNQQNEQQLQKMLQNISINDQQNNLQEFQGQHGQFFTHLENQEKNENLGDEEEGINQILENSRGEQIQNHNRVESNLEIVKNPDLQYDLNSQIFQESVINPDGNEIFKSTNRQILELFPSIQHNVSKGLHSHQNSNISIPYIKNSVCQAELSMINESLHQNQKNNNQNNKIAEVNQYEQFSPEEAANNPHYLFENKTQELNQHKDQQQIEGWNFNQQQILSNNNTQQIQNPINNVNQNQQQNEDEFFMADQYGYLEQGFIETGIETNTKDNQYSNKLNKQNISQKQCQDFMVNQGVFSQNNRYSQQFNNIQKAEDSQTNQSPQYQMDNLDFKLKENSQKQEKILNSQNDFSQKRYDFPLDQVDKSQSDLFQENQDNQDLRFGSSANKTGDQDQIHQIIDQISPQQQENQQDQLNWDDFANKTGSSVDSQIQNSFEIFQQIGHNKETQNQQNKVNFDDLFGFVDQKKSSQNLDQKNNSQIVHLDMNKNQQINNKENDNNLKDNFDFLNFNNNKLANNSDFYDPNSNNKDQNNNNNNSLIASFLKSDDKNNQKIKQMDSSILEKEEKGNTNEYSDIMTNPVMMNYQKNEDKSQSFDMGQKINIQLNQNMSQERINQNPFHDFSNKLNDQDQIFDMGKATSFQDKQQKIEQTFDMNMPMNLNTKKDNIDDSIEVPINQKSKQINMEDSFDMSKPTKLNNKQYKDDEESFDMNKPVNLYKNQNKLEESYDMNKPTNLGQIQEKNEESFDMNKPRQLHFKNDKKEEDGGIFNMEMPRMMHKKSILYENKSPIDINKELDFFLKDIFVPSSKTRQNITPSYNKLDNLKGKSKEIDNVVDSPARGKNIEIALIQQVNPNDVVDMEAPAIFMQNTKKSTQSGNSGGRNNTPNNPSFTHNNFGFGLTGGLSVIAPIEGESDCEQQNMDLGSFSSIAKIQLPAKKQYEFNDLMQLTHQSLASLNLDVGVALSEKIDSPNQIKKFDLQMEKEHSHCFVNSLTNLDHSSKCSQLQSENLKKNKSHNDIRISSASNFNNQNSLKILPFNLKNNLSSYNKQNSQTNNNQLKIVNVTNQIQVKDNGSQEISQKELNMQITEETHQPQLKNTLQSSQTNYVPQINDNDKLNIQHNDLALINVIKENESLQEHIPISKNLQENKTQNKQNVNLGQIFGFTQKKGNQQNNSSLSELQGLQISEQPLQNINIQKKQNQNINQDISCEVDLNSNLKQNDQLTPRNQGEFNNEQINIEKSPGSQSSEGSESFYTVKDKLEVSYQQNIDKDTLGDKKQDDSFYSVSDEQGINQSKQKNEENTAQIDQKLDIQKPSSRDQEDQDIKQQDQNKEQDNNNFMIETDELDKELEYFNQDIKAQEEEKKEKIDLDKSINKFRPFAMNPNGKMSIQITSGNSSFTQQNDSKSIKSPGNNNLTNLSIKNIPKIITYDQINLQSNLNNLPSSKSNKQVTEQSIIENRQIIADMQENILNCNNESAEFQQDQEQRVQSNQNYSAKIENNYKSDQNESIEDHDYQRPRVSSLNIQSYTAQSNTRNVISSKIINDEQSSNTSQDFSCNLNTFLSTRLYPNKQSMLAGSDQDYVLKINFKQKSSEEKTTHLKKISEAQELNSQLEQIQSQGDYNTASDDNCQISLREIKFEKNPFESDFENNSEGSKIKEELNDQDQKEQNHLQKVQKKSESRQNQEVEKSNVAQTGSTLDKKQGLNKRVYKFDFEDYQNPSLVANSSSASPLQKFYQQNNFVEDSMNRNILESEFTINQSHLSEIAANDMQKNGQVENLDFNNLSPISAHKMILKPELFQENAQNNLNSNRSFASQKGTRMPSPPSSVYNQVGKNKSSYYQQKQVQQSGEIQLLVSNTLQSKSQSSNQVNKNQENSQVPPPNMIDEDDMWANMRNESSISQNESDDSYMSDIIQKNILDQQKDFENKDSTSNQNQVIVKQEQETNVQQNKSQRQIDTATQAHPVEAQDFLNDMVNFWNNQNKVYNLNQSNEPQTSSRNNQNNTTNPQILSNAVSSQKNTQIQPDFRREALDKNKTAFFDNTIQGKDKYSLEMNQLIEKQSESQVFDFQPIQTISHQPSNMQDFTFEQKMVSQNQQKISYSERQTAELYNSSDFPRYDSNKTQNSSSNNSKPQHQQKVFDLQRNQDLQYNLILKGNIQDSIIDEESQLKNQSIQNNNKNNFNSSPNSNNLLAEKTRLSEIPTTRTITDSSKNKLSSYIPQNNKSSSNEIKKEGLNPRQVQSIYQPTQNLNFGTFNQDSQLVNLQQQSSSVKEITPTKSYMDISNQFPQYPLRIEISSHPEDPKFFENTDKEKETTKENPTSRTPSTSPKQVFKLATSYLNVPSPQTSFVLNKVKDLTESPNQLFQKNNQSNLPDLGAKKSKSRPSKEDVKVQTILEGIVDLDSLPDFQENIQNKPKDQIKSILEVDEYLERSPSKLLIEEKSEPPKIKLQKTQDFESKLDNLEQLNKQEQQKNKKLQEEFSQIYAEMQKLAEMQLKEADISKQEDFEQKQLSNQIQSLNRQLQLLTQNHAALLNRVESENIKTIKIAQSNLPSFSGDNQTSKTNSEQKLQIIQKELTKDDDKFEQIIKKFKQQKQEISQFRQEIINSAQEEGDKIGKSQQNQIKQNEKNEETETSKNFNNVMEKQSQFSNTLQKILQDIQSLNNVSKKEEVVENQLQKKIKDIQEQVLKNNEKLGEINKYYNEIKTQVNTENRSISPKVKVNITSASIKKSQSPKTIQDIYDNYQSNFKNVNLNSHPKLSQSILQQTTPFNKSPVRDAQLNAKKQKYLQEYESYSTSNQKKRSLSRERESQDIENSFDQKQQIDENSQGYNLQNQFNQNALQQAKQYLHESAQSNSFSMSKNSLLNKLSPSSIRFSSPSNNLATKISSLSPPTQDLQRQNNFSQIKEQNSSLFDKSLLSDLQKNQYFANQAAFQAPQSIKKPPIVKQIPKPQQEKLGQKQQNQQISLQNTSQQKGSDFYQQYQNSNNSSYQQPNQDRQRSFSSSQIVNNINQPGSQTMLNYQNAFNPQQMQSMQNLKQYPPTLFSPQVRSNTEVFDQNLPKFSFNHQQQNENFQQKFQLFKQNNLPFNQNQNNNFSQNIPLFQNTNNYRFIDNNPQQPQPIQSQQLNQFFGNSVNLPKNTNKQVFLSNEKLPTFSQSQAKQYEYEQQQFDRKYPTFQNEVKPFDEKIDSYGNIFRQDQLSAQKQINQGSLYDFKNSFSNVNIIKQKNNNVYTPNKDQTVLLRNQQYKESNFNYSINQYRKNFVSNYYAQNE
ncbi:hypothetical protein TTHERM_00121010 (macronuclear) [Tetrahymena thermophila SB210]|uniref:Uncharacterized protein n=1 Tax=Tetrahymena thermophila (strain SB210) TaxID=312017 RepID=Q22YX0_TETTS|nr:hypothetical protein TTHERM_00121010 [Tetrahymena thermophila SB210]EAR90551.2 hypothetical protein TTHERM_00121010 [Tetrahymena thermophila SB210]|eukprot:XP_001010796.2 hypothetical protein TTHERM_00121010 [Tetrahymena thermophila SB210]